MAVQKAMYTGVESIMSAFDALCNDVPYYSVWYSQIVIGFSFNDTDLEKGKDKLREVLQAAEQNGHNDIIIIKFHPDQEKKFITNKTPVTGTMYVRVNEIGETKPYEQPNQPLQIVAGRQTIPLVTTNEPDKFTAEQWESMTALKNLPQTIAGIVKSEFEALGLDEDDEPEPAPNSIGSIAMEHLKNPDIAKDLISGIFTFLNKFTPAQLAPIAPYLAPIAQQVAGIGKITPKEQVEQTEPEAAKEQTVEEMAQQPEVAPEYKYDVEVLDDSLIRLTKHCQIDTALAMLADYADKNPEEFKSMITGLKMLSNGK